MQATSIYIIVLSTILLLTGCGENKKKVKRAPAPATPVEIVIVKKQKIPFWMKYTGKTKASSSQEVRARVSGILEAIYYKDGEYVSKGQKLFKIEQTDYIATLEKAKAEKRRNLAALKLARADVNRYEPLVQEGLAPRVTLEQYVAQVETLEADIIGDDTAIRQAELELSYTIVKAPIDGQASRRRVDVGNLVGKGESTLLTTINQTDPIYAYFAPSEEEFQVITKLHMEEVMTAYINVNYQSKRLSSANVFGHINFSDNAVDPSTSTVSMRAVIPNKKRNIYPGTFVYVNIFVTDQFELMGVPPEIIFEDQKGEFLYVVDAKEMAKRVYVEAVYETRYFTLLKEDTLKDGDRVIVNGLMRLKPGLKVTPKDVTDTKGLAAVIAANKLLPAAAQEKE